MVIVGCNKEFLETKPSTSVSERDVYSDVTTAKGVVNSVYKQMNSWSSRFGSASTSGWHCAQLVRDCMGPDVCIVKSWYVAETTYSSYNPSNSRVAFMWWECYSAINNLNNVLFNMDELSGTDADKNLLRGEALALRGWCYFELIQTHQHTYAIASHMPGIPIYTEPSTAETKGNPRATVEEVYQQILSDLTTALPLIQGNRLSKMYFNKDVVNAVLAKVYLTMENWSLAIDHARAAKANYPLMSAEEWMSGFKVDNNEWIWSQINTTDETPDWGCAGNMLGWKTGGSEAGWRISSALVSEYSDTDIRKSLIEDDGTGFYANGKWENIVDPIHTADYPFIRSAEMYLIEAEALAKSNKESEARTALFAIQQRVDPAATMSTASGQDLIDEILMEKRKEFWGEGVYFRDMLRNQLTLVRDANHRQDLQLDANSWRFIYPIPESEIQINESIEIEDQNPTSGVFRG